MITTYCFVLCFQPVLNFCNDERHLCHCFVYPFASLSLQVFCHHRALKFKLKPPAGPSGCKPPGSSTLAICAATKNNQKQKLAAAKCCQPQDRYGGWTLYCRSLAFLMWHKDMQNLASSLWSVHVHPPYALNVSNSRNLPLKAVRKYILLGLQEAKSSVWKL